MPAKGKPTKQNRKATREQKRARRRARVWNLFMAGTPKSTIAAIVDCAPQTVTNDIEEMAQEIQELEPLYAKDIRERAIYDRRHLKNLSLEASAETAPKDRGPLLGEARKNQEGIEKLQGLDPDEQAAPPIVPIVVQISGADDPLSVGDISDEDLERGIAENAPELPEPAADEEEPPAEYTPVEEPAEPPSETAS